MENLVEEAKRLSDEKAREALDLAQRVSDKADAKADSLLSKAMASKWTWAIMLAGAVVFVAALFN